MNFLAEPIRFTAELLPTMAIFSFWLERRDRFLFRLMFSLLVLTLFSFTWPAEWDGMVKMVKYLLVFLLCVCALFFLFRITFWEALYRGAAAYATQHVAFLINSCISYDLFSGLFESGTMPYYILSALVYLATYVLIYRCLSRRIRKEGLYGLDNRFLVCFVLIMVLMAVCLNYVRILNLNSYTWITSLITNLYAIIGCVFALFIQSGMHQRSQLERKLEISEHMLHRQEEQFRVSEETIDCINLKCHDLKHQMIVLRRKLSDPDAQAVLRNLADTVMIYDSVVKTGNEALDVILTEKSLLCEQNQIQLTCMADGKGVSGIRDTDLYSIFGNLLDNAMESVRELPNPEQRVIGLTVTNPGNLLLIHTENYYNHPVRMEDGLPVTTKADTRFHGFGMRSIRLLVERYGGTLSIHTEDSIFSVNIMIPTVRV